jgi:hypothetical protein
MFFYLLAQMAHLYYEKNTDPFLDTNAKIIAFNKSHQLYCF